MTIWRKNEPTPIKRRADLIIYRNDGSLAPRGTDFMSLLCVWFGGASSPNLAAAAGTMSNKRMPLAFADQAIAGVDTAADTLNIVGHPFQTGDGIAGMSNVGGAIPTITGWTGSAYVIVVDANHIAFADTLAHAYAGTKMDITAAGSGTNKVIALAPNTTRGLDGRFTYEATQTETNHDAPESVIVVDNFGSLTTDFSLGNGGGGSAYVSMDVGTSLLDTVITSDGKTVGDCLRLGYWVDGGGKIIRDLLTGAYRVRDNADSKDVATGVLDSTGRPTAATGDLS